MLEKSQQRLIDAGGPFMLHEHDPPPECGHGGVCVDTQLDAAHRTDDRVVLSLRRAKGQESGSVQVEKGQVFVTLSLATGDCSPHDAQASAFLAEHGWLARALAARVDWVRLRVQRAASRRDRTGILAALARAEPGAMVPHHDVCPADWDLLFNHEGCTYWAIVHHCPNPSCTCTEIVVELQRIDPQHASHVGRLEIDFAVTRVRPKASTAKAAALFAPLWAEHAAELVMRYGEVRRAVRQLAALREAELHGAPAHDEDRGPARPRISRNAPCPCGSGKKYKRCCADGHAAAARADADAGPSR